MYEPSEQEQEEHQQWHEAWAANVDLENCDVDQRREVALTLAASKFTDQGLTFAALARSEEFPDDREALTDVAASSLASAVRLASLLVGDVEALDVVKQVVEGTAHCVPQALAEAKARIEVEAFLVDNTEQALALDLPDSATADPDRVEWTDEQLDEIRDEERGTK